MEMFRKSAEIQPGIFNGCHGGEGDLICYSLLDGLKSLECAFLHKDLMAPGVSIGEHLHDRSDEVYYLLSGKGVLTFDGETYEMAAGDISLCTCGHSHGFLATEDSVLIVIGS